MVSVMGKGDGDGGVGWEAKIGLGRGMSDETDRLCLEWSREIGGCM